MTRAFDTFVKVYKLYGKEKIDGVFLTEYASLDPEEVSIVEDMLIKDALKFDTIAILGLGELKSNGAETALKSLLSQVTAPSYVYLSIVEALYKITRETFYQKAIVYNMNSIDNSLRRQAAIALENTIPSQITFSTFVEMLKREKDPVIETIAAKGILMFFGLMKSANDHDNFDKYLHLIRLLCDSVDENSLDVAISEVEKEAAKLKG